jgi:hypothetical protein
MMTPLRAKKTTSFFTPLLKADSLLSANVRGSGAGSFLRQSASRCVRRFRVAAYASFPEGEQRSIHQHGNGEELAMRCGLSVSGLRRWLSARRARRRSSPDTLCTE